jgi:anaerobic magnesium-protoporphyrin IX monomethyl ester cyclase
MIVELIHPPHFNSTDDRLDPPLGLLYIGTYLRENTNATVHLTDLSGVKRKDDIEVGYADVYGITVYCATVPTVTHIINECRFMNPNCKIVIGGAHITAMPRTLHSIVDHAIMGYGEEPMKDIASRKMLPHYVHGNNLLKPFKVDWSLIDPLSYHRELDGKKSLPILTSRGCPYECAFCGLNAMHDICRSVQFAEADNVIEAVKEIKDLGIGALNIQDDIFTLKRSRLKKILKGVAKLDMPFRCMGRAGYDTEETYKMLSDAGCTGVAWGIESGSQYMLDRMNKATKVEDNYNVIEWCKKYGMDARAFFIIGFPGETKETLEETKEFIKKADPDQYFCSNFVPYPGTDVWNNPESFGITKLSKDFNQYYQVSKDGTGGINISTEWMTADQFKQAETELRAWLKEHKPLRGKNVQQYEKGDKDGNKRCNLPESGDQVHSTHVGVD